jgi:ElaB/YqjD/DUF883 family membrane-anchored ribosome-binding protein
MTQAATNMGQRAVGNRDRESGSHVANLRGDLERLGEDAASIAKHAAGAAKSGVAEVKTRVSDAVEAARDKGIEATDQLSDYIKDRPLTSVAIALGAGVLLGALVRRL